MTSVSNQEKSINGSIDLNTCFSWFDKKFGTTLKELTKSFLGSDINFYLFAITNGSCFVWKNSEYFVTQINISKDLFVHLRVSEVATRIILDNTLGPHSEYDDEFEFKNLTELEAMIITAFNKHLFEKATDIFLSKEDIPIPQTYQVPGLLNLTFYVKAKKSDLVGKLIFSFPELIINKPEPLLQQNRVIDILNIEDGQISLDIVVGHSKISLKELKGLEPEDILLLEESNINFISIKTSQGEVSININPDPRLVLDLDDEEDEKDSGEGQMSDLDNNKTDIWDNLQVDVTAEFEKIRMTVGEIKQITEGLIVDVAPLVDNRLFLQVEGKQIALGELVIIGEKYGVKITKILQGQQDSQDSSADLPVQIEEKNYEEETYEPTPQISDNAQTDEKELSEDKVDENTDQSADEDFDYSDFEIDDDE